LESERRRRRRRLSLDRFAPYAVLGISVSVLFLLWFLSHRAAAREERLVLRSEIQQLQNRFAARVEQQNALLRGTSGLLSVDPNVSRMDFRRFVDNLQLGSRYPGTLALGLVRRMKPAEIPSFEAQLRREGLEGARVYPSIGEKPRVELWPLVYIEPQTDANKHIIGFDMETEPSRSTAMAQACDSGNPTLSTLTKFVTPPGQPGRSGFCIYMPIYEGGAIPDSVEKRRAKIVGFIYSPFRAESVIDPIVNETPSNLDFDLYDGDSTKSPQFYRRHPSPANREEREITSSFPISGRTWTMVASRDAGVESNLIGFLPLVGGMICAVLFLLSLSQSNARRRTEAALVELERAESGQRLLAESGVLLSQSLDYSTTLKAVANLAVPSFADWAAVDMLGSDDTITRVATIHRDPQKLATSDELLRRWPTKWDDPGGVAKVLRTHEPEFVPEIQQGDIGMGVSDPERAELIRTFALTSIMIVPVINRDRIYGALTVAQSESQRHYTQADLEIACEIGRRAGLSVENSLNAQAAKMELEERTRAEEQVRHLNEDLERIVEERTLELAAANKELEAFCYSVSHDLRAPLRSIDGFTKAIHDDYFPLLDESGRDYLARVRSAAQRMDELITSLLTLSRITRSEMKRQSIDLSEVAQQSFDEQVRSNPSPHVTIAIEPEMKVVADPHMTRLILDNLISNAIKFASKNPDAHVTIGSTTSKGRVAFFVRDNGAGFNPAYANKLFMPFERLHSPKDYPGSGIGLATVERIVTKHGGEVWAESEEGKGAIFYFTLGDA
jgi:signal transduction histidine kinase/CHASE1-domain containing sensor protein